METLPWWEFVVKPGVRKLGSLRGRQRLKDSRAELNLLLVRQAYINKKVNLGFTSNCRVAQSDCVPRSADFPLNVPRKNQKAN